MEKVWCELRFYCLTTLYIKSVYIICEAKKALVGTDEEYKHYFELILFFNKPKRFSIYSACLMFPPPSIPQSTFCLSSFSDEFC